ncbi:uncharacterized protein TNCV_3151811 [Trichonephila clavipes]|nr:uncharacterized protein TNCV_3151811 [Trichonephila clavipes]
MSAMIRYLDHWVTATLNPFSARIWSRGRASCFHSAGQEFKPRAGEGRLSRSSLQLINLLIDEERARIILLKYGCDQTLKARKGNGSTPLLIERTEKEQCESDNAAPSHWITMVSPDSNDLVVLQKMLGGRDLYGSASRQNIDGNKLSWQAIIWQQVVFSDELRFNLWDHDGRIRVRRYAGECCLPECIIERHSGLTPKLLIRGVISYHGRSNLLRIEDNLNIKKREP